MRKNRPLSEEKEDEEGVSGAPRMIEDGAMEDLDAVPALHVDAVAESGAVRLGSGMMYAGADFFKASIIGKGGHGGFMRDGGLAEVAYPEWTILACSDKFAQLAA